MKRRVALSLDAELLDRADSVAETLGQSRTTFVERALEQVLDGRRAARVPGDLAAEKAKREAPPDRRVKSSAEARPRISIPKAGKR